MGFLSRLLSIIFVLNGCFLLAEEEVDSLANKAHELFSAGLYAEAIPFDQQILKIFLHKNAGEGLDEQPLIKAARSRLRLARSHFFLGNPKEVIASFKEYPIYGLDRYPEVKELEREEKYLSAVAYREMGMYENAIQELYSYLSDQSVPLYYEALYELGLNHYFRENFNEAKRVFSLISDGETRGPLGVLASFYLARIDLHQGDYLAAEGALDFLSMKIPKEDSIHYEYAYLKGEVAFKKGDYSQAARYFGEALPKLGGEHSPWYRETLFHLAWCHLKMGQEIIQNVLWQKEHLQKATEAFETLLARFPEEKVYLALGQCYLTRARCLKEEAAYVKAEELLSKQEPFLTREGLAKALLLRAEAASSYEQRDKFYRLLTQDANQESPFYAKGWYLRGVNHFEEGERLQANKQAGEANQAFDKAANAFKKAFEKHIATEKTDAGLALKYQAQAYERQNTQEGRLAALYLLENILDQKGDILISMENPDEIFYLYGLVAAELSQEDPTGYYFALAEKSLQRGVKQFPQGKFADVALTLLAVLHFRQHQYKEAEETYLLLADQYPQSPYVGEAWLWAAYCSEKLGRDEAEKKNRLNKVFQEYANSPVAAEAYFNYYSYRDYLQGDRAALKHLQAFSREYPDSPYLLQAQYLIGLDYKRDRKTPEGKWIRKKNLTAAIDAFQDVETTYDRLSEKQVIPNEQQLFYLKIRYRATLERALANLAIAEESQGAKRQIYLEYAEEVFQQLVKNFENPRTPFIQQLHQENPYPQMLEESTYWLAQTYLKAQNDESAEKIFSKMLDRYRYHKTTRGYFLSRVWYDQGMIAFRRNEHTLALECLKRAEDSAKGKLLTTEQRLDLWIQESQCFKELKQWDNAILILSKVINDDAISSLRLKAMLLRAEIYELQRRPELARKQLLTTAKKGGEWAMKAKEKLEKEYGY